MDTIFRAGVLVVLGFSLSCGGAVANAPSKPLPPGAHTPVRGEDGLYENCSVLFEGNCYAQARDACAAANCVPGDCTILRTYPGQIGCERQADHSAAAPE